MTTWTLVEARAELTERGYATEDVDAVILSWLDASDGDHPLTDDDMGVLVDQLDNSWIRTVVHELRRPGSDDWETLEEVQVSRYAVPTSQSQAETDIRDCRAWRGDYSPGHHRIRVMRGGRLKRAYEPLWLVNPDRRTEYAHSAASYATGWVVTRTGPEGPAQLSDPCGEHIAYFDADDDEGGWSWSTYEVNEYGDKLLIGTDGTDEADPTALLADHLRRTWTPL